MRVMTEDSCFVLDGYPDLPTEWETYSRSDATALPTSIYILQTFSSISVTICQCTRSQHSKVVYFLADQ